MIRRMRRFLEAASEKEAMADNGFRENRRLELAGRYTSEARPIYGVIAKRVGEVPYLAHEYSIADMGTYPWIRLHILQGQDSTICRA